MSGTRQLVQEVGKLREKVKALTRRHGLEPS
jgi:hypothetical protein